MAIWMTRVNYLPNLIKGLLLATFIISPFVVVASLYFPFVSGRVYFFRFLVEITLFFWAILITRSPEYRPRLKDPLVFSSLLFLAGLIVTGVLGVDPIHSFFSNIERADGIIQFSHWILYFLMVISVFKTRRDWLVFLGVFAGVAFAVALYAWFLNEPRLAGYFNNTSYLAAFMLFAIGLTFILWQELTKESEELFGSAWWGLLFGGLILFFAVTLVFTQTRGAYLGFTAGFGLLAALLFFFRKTHKKLAFIVGSLFLIFLLSASSIFLFKDKSLIKNNQLLNRIADISLLTGTSAGRERVLAWQIALEGFRDKPIFGWGPENYDIVFNANYKFLAAKDEPWFDSSHNQALDVLSEGGLFLFSLYLFWIGSIFYVTGRIFRRGAKEKLTAAILASTYLAFLVQGWFIFDTFPFYLGLFPLLGFAYFEYEAPRKHEGNKKIIKNARLYALTALLIFLVPFLILKLVWQPYQANTLIFKSQAYLSGGSFREAGFFFKKASEINSPFTNFDVGNQIAWSLLYILDRPLPEKSREQAYNFYQLVLAREEKSLQYRPLDPQAYYVLGRLYRRGFEIFGKPEYLAKAEVVLKRGREISYDRAEYVGELADVLLLEEKNNEVEEVVKEYAARIGPPYSHLLLGNLYFMEGEYDLTAGQYERAEETGYEFWSNDIYYARYIKASEEVKNYGKILKLSSDYLAHRKPAAEVFYNQATAYLHLGKSKEARDALAKAIALDSRYAARAVLFPKP